MSQQFQVLRCFSCQTFQVQQVKKSSRWRCKLCGEKQTLLKEFGRGSGADCRRHVQKLNAMRGAMLDQREQTSWSLWEGAEQEGEEAECAAGDSRAEHDGKEVSRWTKYLNQQQEGEGLGAELESSVRRRGEEEHTWTPGQTDRHRRRRPPERPHAAAAATSTPRPPHLPGGGLVAPPPTPHWAQQEGEELCERGRGCGRSLTVGGASALAVSGSDQSTVTAPRKASVMQAPPTQWPRPLLPVSSLFDSGEDFSLDL
ncbi:MRN complex-interacting protein [Myripristis murdjan]|uniref:MRN complex-interacting protein n=1 Tax=Myripristis murdjan TaxID=586833 RepID=UPI001175FC9B|nr:MRN complex-interacting protein [Myripristis murdjan]